MDALLTHPCGHESSLEAGCPEKDRLQCHTCGLQAHIETAPAEVLPSGLVMPGKRTIIIDFDPRAPLTPEEKDILNHTVYYAVGGFYCGAGPAIESLVGKGLMEFAGKKSFVPDPYYRITRNGRAALRWHKANEGRAIA